jgi:hypothetical protein
LLYLAAAASFALAIFHAIAQAVWHTPVGLLELHYVVTILLPAAGWRSEHRAMDRVMGRGVKRKQHKRSQGKKDEYHQLVQQFRSTGE